VRHEHLARYRFVAERAGDRIVVDCASGDGTCARMVAERVPDGFADLYSSLETIEHLPDPG
jgi:hypothetical protein